MQTPGAGTVVHQDEDAPLKAGNKSLSVTVPEAETVDYGRATERFP